jgi:hypothetical protein
VQKLKKKKNNMNKQKRKILNITHMNKFVEEMPMVYKKKTFTGIYNEWRYECKMAAR